MKVDTMRNIDFYIGVPLCLAATWVFKLIRRFAKPARTTPKNVLLIELSEMGSTILADPAMQKLKTSFDANLHFAIFRKNRSSLYLLNTVEDENIFTLRENSLTALLVDTLRFLKWARKRKIDTVIDLELFSRFTSLLTGFSGAVNRVGFYSFYNEGLYRGELLTHRVAYNPHIHIAKNFIALVNALSAETPEVPYSKTKITDEEINLRTVSYTGEQTSAVREKINRRLPAGMENYRIVLVNPNASELLVQRRWPPDYYDRLINLILDHSDDLLVLITGAPGEKDEAELLKNRIGSERCINFAGQLTLIELPLLYSISHLMISNDSGPGHFSAITSMPSFVIFGPETPALYGSLGNSTPIYAGLACSPCVSAWNHRKTACQDNVCLQVISPQYVFEIIKPTLEM